MCIPFINGYNIGKLNPVIVARNSLPKLVQKGPVSVNLGTATATPIQAPPSSNVQQVHPMPIATTTPSSIETPSPGTIQIDPASILPEPPTHPSLNVAHQNQSHGMNKTPAMYIII